MHVVLFQPEIPPNTGSIARLCAATLTPLHLIEPLGFKIDDRHLKRAGLDYWQFVDLRVHKSWDEFVAAVAGETVALLFQTGGEILYQSTLPRRTLSSLRARDARLASTLVGRQLGFFLSDTHGW